MGNSSPAKQVVLMGLFQAASAVTPFLVLPAVARTSSPSDWSAFVLGQSVGAFAAILVSYGWPLSGITAVARLDSAEEKAEILATSLVSRLVVVIPVSALVLLVVLGVARPEQPAVALVVSLGLMFSSGLSFNWFFIGDSRIDLAIIFSVIPVMVSAGATALVLPIGGSPSVYGLFLIVSTIMSGAVLLRLTGTSSYLRTNLGTIKRSALSRLRAEIAVASSQWSFAVYLTLPMVVASTLLSTEESARYASADRVTVLGITALAAIGSVLQAWVSKLRFGRRGRTALWVTVASALTGGGFIILLGDIVFAVFFGEIYALGLAERVVIAGVLLFYSVRGANIRFFLIPYLSYKAASVISGVGLVMLGMGFSVTLFSSGFERPIDVLYCLLAAEGAAAIASVILAYRAVRAVRASSISSSREPVK